MEIVINMDNSLCEKTTGAAVKEVAGREASAILDQGTPPPRKERDSNIELFRIIAMLLIVAHHYFVNSGLLETVAREPTLTARAVFLLLFGWGGKTGINCFLFITGYFMCTSKFTIKKFLKLLFAVEFYQIVNGTIFLLAGYSDFSFKSVLTFVTPFYGIGRGFTSSFIVFFLFIPFLNIMAAGMNKTLHQRLLLILFAVFTLIPSIMIPPFFYPANVIIGYVGWFMTVYLFAAYLRLYPESWFGNRKIWAGALLTSIALSWGSVIAFAWLQRLLHYQSPYYPYILISDSNKILAFATALSAFMFFKNLSMKYSKLINVAAACTFGVLLAHTSTSMMRRWLWLDLLKNVSFYDGSLGRLAFHAIWSVFAVYAVCTLIEMARLRFIEKPLFRYCGERMEKMGPIFAREK